MANFSCKDYSSIFNAWCHFEGDSYFTQKRFPDFSGTEGVLYGLANISASDTWRTMVSVPLYADNSAISGTSVEQLSCIAAGAFPTFSYRFCNYTTPGTYTVTRDSSKLTVGDSTLSKTSFRDGVIPKFILAVVQGAGGGGGGTTFTDDGCGGGAGGFVAGVIELPENCILSLVVGKGGKGGDFHPSGSSSDMSDPGSYAEAGESSSIALLSPSHNYIATLMEAYGGGRGMAATENSSSNKGGTGGTAEYNADYVHCAVTVTGGHGGAVYSKDNATGCSATTVRATANTSNTLGAGSGIPLYKTWPATSGGAQGHNNAPGGGGGSVMASGPAGGTSALLPDNAMPAAGTSGAGGAGGRFYFMQYRYGSRGGHGVIELYY